MTATTHRSGSLKQSNKLHKTNKSYRSKRAVSRGFSGRVRSGSKSSTKSNRSTLSKVSRSDRVNKSKLARNKKKLDLINQRRRTGVLKSAHGAPINVGFLQLSPTSNGASVIENLKEECDNNDMENDEIVSMIFHSNLKTRLNVYPIERNIVNVLDACKICDALVFHLTPDPEVTSYEDILFSLFDENGRNQLEACKAQSFSSAIICLDQFDSIPQKLRSKVKAQLTSFFKDQFGKELKLVCLETGKDNGKPKQKRKKMMKVEEDEAMLKTKRSQKCLEMLIRTLRDTRISVESWKETRTYFLANAQQVAEDSRSKIIAVDTFVRGKPINIHSLFHIVGYTNFNLFKVEQLHLRESKKTTTLFTNETKLSPLFREAEGDLFAGEQTWPTEAEINAAENLKATKEEEEDYMAAWKVDDDGDSGSEFSDTEFVKINATTANVADAEEMMEIDLDQVKKEVRFKELKREELEEEEFPDEREVPHELAAKERFIKYRGLKNFKKSFWHPKESLPQDYSRVFQLDNTGGIYNKLKQDNDDNEKLFLKQLEDVKTKGLFTLNDDKETLCPGQYCKLYFRIDETVAEHMNLFNALKEESLSQPLVIFSCHEHEEKLSVLTANIKKVTDEVDTVVKSKEEIIVQCGFWRTTVRPVFSENTLNTNKHRFLKFLPSGKFCSATFYGNICFGQLPVLFLKKDRIMASGNLRSEKEALDVDRIILKRVILTGYPIRVKKNKAVIRFMFHRPEDVKWFKPVQLWTKMGASGAITESLGTHGLFKARFDRVMKSNDTVCLSLYKRIYPK